MSAPGHTKVLHGAVYQISRQDQEALDLIEGLGRGYRLVETSLKSPDGNMIDVFTYQATHIDGRLRPYDWYVQHVLQGARQWALPLGHIEMIASVQADPDPDSARRSREMAFHA